MRTHLLMSVLLIAALGPSRPIAAQAPVPLQTGDTVRVRTSQMSGRFFVVGVTTDRVTLSGGGRDSFSLAMGALTDLSVLRGRHTTGRSAWIGFRRGFLIGAAVGAVSGLVDGDTDSGAFIDWTAEEKAVLAGFLFGTVGGALGGLYGAATGIERWDRIPLASPTTLRVTPNGAGGITLGVAIRF